MVLFVSFICGLWTHRTPWEQRPGKTKSLLLPPKSGTEIFESVRGFEHVIQVRQLKDTLPPLSVQLQITL